MFLIMSGAYIEQELRSEFGDIPPSFLPLGNRRLFEHQLDVIPADKVIYLSLPASYTLQPSDIKRLKARSVTIIKTPDNLSLGASLLSALTSVTNSTDKTVQILFGDTLINPLPVGEDILTISEVLDSYDWAAVTNDSMHWIESHLRTLKTDNNDVISGYFCFSQPEALIEALKKSDLDFLSALNIYHNTTGLAAIKTDDWLDFGHIKTYYRSKASFTTQRAFNELQITPEWIEKSGEQQHKIKAEAQWFEQLPSAMRTFIPQYLGQTQNKNKSSYRLEYLHNTALNELFVFAELPNITWKHILYSCFDFINRCSEYKTTTQSNNLTQLFTEKTLPRLTDFCQAHQIDINQQWIFNQDFSASLTQLYELSEQHLPSHSNSLSLLHGDFCFSNILYDFRTCRIKTIDPRGLTHDNKSTIYGDVHYDLAKLSHSVLGMYDWIIAEYYELIIDDNNIHFTVAGLTRQAGIQKIFTTLAKQHYDVNEINLYAMQIQLFLSMLPLHHDKPQRQFALMANAFRLYQIIKRLKQ